MPRKTATDAAHPLDVALGAQVRRRRKELGLSQDELGRAVGVTFQQMQKYEHGANRISFSRLVEISGALKSSVADLIGDLDRIKSTGMFGRQSDYLRAPGANELLEAYASLSSPKRRRALVSLARQLASDTR